MTHQTIVVLDFGSQYTQLIARRLRELAVYSEILPPTTSVAEIKRRNPVGIIFSGGPRSVSEPGAPRTDPAIFALGTPTLGICYGMQLMTDELGGKVASAPHREFGLATVTLATSGGWLGTWIGSTIGMVAADAQAIAVGAVLGRRLPDNAIRYGAAGLFGLFGALLIIEGVTA